MFLTETRSGLARLTVAAAVAVIKKDTKKQEEREIERGDKENYREAIAANSEAKKEAKAKRLKQSRIPRRT